MSQPNWSEIVLNPDWLKRLESLAKRRFADRATAEEATTYVLDHLSADDWVRCRQYSGTAQPTTYLHSLAANLIEEFSRTRCGRPRPPAWLTRQGELWVILWQRICLERDMVQQVVDRLCAGGLRDSGKLHGIVRCIKARLPWCGSSTLPIPTEYISADSEPRDIPDVASAHSLLEDALAHEQLDDTLATLAAIIYSDEDTRLALSEKQLRRCRERLHLDAEELLMLRMHFRDGLSVAAIARALGIPSHQPGRQINRTLKSIQQVFDAAGVSLDAAFNTLNSGLETRS